MKDQYQKTMYACFVGYIVQAIVNNFVPLLFLTFEKTYQIPLSQITMLITFNFGIQLLIDLLSAKFVDKIGYRIAIVLAHACSAAGLIGLVILPELFSSAFTGIFLSVVIYAVGGGLIEVLISPIVESCPSDNKEKAMSLLHSFYCWGHVAVVLLSTVFFRLFGISNWKILALAWAVIPIVNGIVFTKVPIAALIEEGETGMTIRELCKNLDRFMIGSSILCMASYLCISLAPSPVLSLIGCAICGFSVGIMWPGSFSKASAALRNGGTSLFALLALAGDVGCSGGPTLVGFVSGLASDNLKKGILAGMIFPVLLLAGILLLKRKELQEEG